MFSRVHGKVVFIDFGLSKVILQNWGFKTYTGFRGTPNFVSNAMLELLGPGAKKAHVDLYYNDLICLQNVYNYRNVKKRFSETFGEMDEEESDSDEISEIELPSNYDYIVNIYELMLIRYQAYFEKAAFRAAIIDEKGKLVK